MKIGLAQINTIVGDLKGNTKKILNAYKKLCDEGANIVLFSELTICGYPPRDLLLKSHFVSDCKNYLEKIIEKVNRVPAIIGFPESNPKGSSYPFYNSAAWIEKREIIHVARKCLLPTYGVFDEDRYFKAAKKPISFKWKNKNIGITICEDIWTKEFSVKNLSKSVDPVKILGKEKLDLMLNLSASPWYFKKQETRRSLISVTAQRCGCPVIYVNQVGGCDGLIFDGRSLVANKKGTVIARLKRFKEELRVINLDDYHEAVLPKPSKVKDIHDALVLGVRDYTRKTGFKTVMIGISGGIDSAVTAVIATKALGAKNTTAINLPSAISSKHSKKDAQTLAKKLGIHFYMLAIHNIVEESLKTLLPIFKNKPRDITEENLQARIRGLLLMSISNKTHSLLLTTGNKSELAVGYCTLYGDMVGGLGVLSDVTKTKVYELANYINRNDKVIPQSTIDKPPSAELAPDQFDQDTLPPYDVLDQIVCYYIEDNFSISKIIEMGLDKKIVHQVITLINKNEYKRRQAALGIKISPLAFGVERQMPIVQKYEN